MGQPDVVLMQTATSGPKDTSTPNVVEDSSRDPVPARLQELKRWYSQSAQRNKRWFTACKAVSIVVAAAIPLLSGFGDLWLGSHLTLTLGLLGAVIVVIEGLLRLFQWEQT